LDDCFGKHQYGYAIDGREPITEEQFRKNYQPMPESNGKAGA
jgi:hypothetical protein